MYSTSTVRSYVHSCHMPCCMKILHKYILHMHICMPQACTCTLPTYMHIHTCHHMATSTHSPTYVHTQSTNIYMLHGHTYLHLCTHKHPHMQVYQHYLHHTCACTYEKHIYTGVYQVTILHTHIHDTSHPHIIAQAHLRTCIYTMCTCRCASLKTTYTRYREYIRTPSHKHVHI